MNSHFVVAELYEDENIENFLCDMDGKTYFYAACITDDKGDMRLENFFDVSPLITIIKDVTVLICQETGKGNCVVVGCMKNAEILRKHINYDWCNCWKQIVCDAVNAFIVPESKRNKFYKIKDYTFDNSRDTEKYDKGVYYAEKFNIANSVYD